MQKYFVLIFYCTFHEILLLLIVEGGAINFDALHQLLYLFPLWYHDQPKLVPSPQYTSITLRYTIGDGKLPAVRAVTLVTLKIQMYPDGYRICILRVTIGGYQITAW